MARPAPRVAAVACVVACGAIGRVSRASAAGVNWTCRTASAPWAGRYSHTSVVDAAGAIYVIGGGEEGGNIITPYKDVWASTDGGARPDSVKGGMVGGYSRRGTLEGAEGGLGGTKEVVWGY
jgi:hypothetical protein